MHSSGARVLFAGTAFLKPLSTNGDFLRLWVLAGGKGGGGGVGAVGEERQ